jgi:hypothetical protein
VCVDGTCTAACTADSQCATGDYCNQGACVVDTRPTPNCTTSAQCTGQNQTCVGGYCLYNCTTNTQCEMIDARIGYCSSAGVCRSQAEANPQCTQQSDCASGQDCIGNVCM